MDHFRERLYLAVPFPFLSFFRPSFLSIFSPLDTIYVQLDQQIREAADISFEVCFWP